MSLKNKDQLEFAAVTSERWDDFEELFGTRGAYGGCWCMWWRLTRKEFEDFYLIFLKQQLAFLSH